MSHQPPVDSQQRRRTRRTASVLLALLTFVALAGVAATQRQNELPRASGTAQPGSVRRVPTDPWEPAAPDLPAAPRITRTATVPAEWQTADDIAPLWAAWIETVPDGSTIVFPAGRYRARDTLNVFRRNDLVLQGPGTAGAATIVQVGDGYEAERPPQRSAIVVHSSHRIVVEGLTIEGANRRGSATDPMNNPLEGQHGINVTWDCTDVRVSNNRISNTYGDGISTQGRSTRVLIEGNTIRDVGRQGISSIDAFDSTIRGNDVAGTAINGIDVEPNRAGARVSVENNLLAGKGATLAALGPRLSDVSFSHNRIRGPLRVLLYSEQSTDRGTQRLRRLRVEANTGSALAGPDEPAIEAVNVDFLSVEDNTSAGVPASIWLIGSCPVKVPGDRLRGPDRSVRFAPAPESGYARHVKPALVLGLSTDRVNPVDGITYMYERIRGRSPDNSELSAAATRVCTGASDRSDLAASLLADWRGPVADEATAVATDVVLSGRLPPAARPTGSAPLARDVALARDTHPRVWSSVREVSAAFLIVRSRLPTPSELIMWVQSTQRAPYRLADLIRSVDALATRTRPGSTDDHTCDDQGEADVSILAAPLQPLVAVRSTC